MRRSAVVWRFALLQPRRYLTTTPTTPSKPSKPLPNVIKTLEGRGFMADMTHPELHEHVQSRTCIYAGVDPSASSLHVGNLVALMGLLHFRLAGHDVLALIGGATGSIGDPSGRSSERTALSPGELKTNVDGITTQVHRFFENGEKYLWRNPTRRLYTGPDYTSEVDGSGRAVGEGDYASAGSGESGASAQTRRAYELGGSVKVLNNHDWFRGISFLDFLRDVGKLAKVNTMIARDSVKSRLNSENGISFTEFSYQLLQAYDFAHLHREHDCRIQLGGSDQWGNIVAGIDLIKRQRAASTASAAGASGKGGVKGLKKGREGEVGEEGETEVVQEPEPAYGMTFRLITTENGEKFGKSAGNAVWLDSDRTSVTDFYQFFYRLSDAAVEQQLKMLTFLPLERIEEIMREHDADRTQRRAQKILAREVTELVHGYDSLQTSLKSSQYLYTTPPTSITAAQAHSHLHTEKFFHRVKWADIGNKPITKILVQYGLCPSRAEATRLVRNKAVSYRARVVLDPLEAVKKSELGGEGVVVIRVGKRFLVLYLEDW